MNTDTAHATNESAVAPPTPDDYALLREYLDANGLWATQPWPCVLFLEYDGSAPGPTAQAERRLNLRAAWWTRRTAPRREAHADSAADDRLLAAGADGHLAWLCDGGAPEIGPHNHTPAQMRARLAFDGATGVVCVECQGRGLAPGYVRLACRDCNGAGRVYPEAVPQADPASGDEPCGCVHRGPYGYEIERFAHNAVAYTELRHDRDCKWCRGTGNVRDGRGNPFSSGYVPGEKCPIWLKPGGDASLPEAALVELACRREQSDAFGHPWLCRLHLHHARAPLAELLHKETP